MTNTAAAHPKQSHQGATPTSVRVVLVGQTGLESRISGAADIAFVRTRTPLEAVGELATNGDQTKTVVIVGPDAEPNGSLAAFLEAARSARPGVRIARADDSGYDAVRDGYDAAIRSDATPEMVRRLVATDRESDASPAAEIQRTELKPSAESTAPPIDDRPSQEVEPTAGSAAPRDTDGPITLPPPSVMHAESAADADEVDESGRGAEIARKGVAARPSTEVGDSALLATLDGTRAQMLDAALPLIASRLGVPGVVFVIQGTPDTGTAPVPSVPVIGGGKRFGTLRVETDEAFGTLIDSDPSDLPSSALAPHAAWLGGWLSLHERQHSLRRAAFTDPLTGAWNRRYFDGFLESALDRARDARRTVTVLIFDIDGFKRYNDDYGHPAGDEILIETVRALKSSVRPSDRVCRIGGDEFAVIFDEPEGPRVRGSKPPESVYVLAKRVQRKIGEKKFPKLGDDAPGQLTISGGLAAFPWDGHDAETLLQKADDLACASKRCGKNAISLGPGAERVCKNEGDDLVE